MGVLTMTSRFASIIALGISLTACGSDPLDPGAGDSTGKGTNTLLIEGRASAEPTIPNSQKDTDFRTDFSVRVRLNNADVTTGTVTVTSRFGDVPLTYNTQENRWQGTGTGYDEVYQLDVVSGADKVEGVIVDGPDLHKITAPTAGAALDSTIPNDLKWDRNEKCDVTTLSVGDADRIEDSGSYTMAAGMLKAEKDKAKENQIDLRRSNQVIPAGAITGSTWAVSISQQIDVLANPNPAL
jgi:hypothetical protein